MLKVSTVDIGEFSDLDLEHASVSTEYSIPTGRLDIHISIPGKSSESEFCLAIENKPYAGDGENQVGKYLKCLKDRYADKFCLIYLSPIGARPTAHSLSDDSMNSDQFRVMAYDALADKGEPEVASLTDWLAHCREKTEAEKIRFFLADLRNYFQQNFGGKKMPDERSRGLREWILKNEEYMETT